MVTRVGDLPSIYSVESIAKLRTSLTSLSPVIARSLTDPNDTGRHLTHVAELAFHFATHMNLAHHLRDDLVHAAIIHDIGKMLIPRSVLDKPSKLTDSERKIIETHVERGVEHLYQFSNLTRAQSIMAYHHERLDGKGYPYHPKNEDIGRFSRMLTILDSFSAMTMERIYNKVFTEREALDELKRYSGTQFDGVLVDFFEDSLSRTNSARCVLPTATPLPGNHIVIGGLNASKHRIAKELSREVGFSFLDTDVYYRSLALLALAIKADISDVDQMVDLAREDRINLFSDLSHAKGCISFADGKDTTPALNSVGVTKAMNTLKSYRNLDEEVIARAREFARYDNSVIIGSMHSDSLLPEAPHKFDLLPDSDFDIKQFTLLRDSLPMTNQKSLYQENTSTSKENSIPVSA